MERNERAIMNTLNTFIGKIFDWKDIKEALEPLAGNVSFELHSSFTTKFVIVNGYSYAIDVDDDYIVAVRY